MPNKDSKFKFKIVGTSRYGTEVLLARHRGREEAEENLRWFRKTFRKEIQSGEAYTDLRIENI